MIQKIFSKKQLPFLYSELGKQKSENSLFHVIPVPLEQSVSYGSGTCNGPAAILEASQQLELFDGKSVPADQGIYTHYPVRCKGGIHDILENISDVTGSVLLQKKIPVILGGEHTVTVGALMGVLKHVQDVGVVQFDAHADLRDTYENNQYSHACVMRRLYDMEVPFLQIGIRSLSQGEVVFRKDHDILHNDAVDLYHNGIPERILPVNFPSNIYITFDIDCLDCSLVPSTGTPEPGGLGWWQAMKIVEQLSREAVVCGFDVVELAPRKDSHSSDFVAARLTYNLMGFAARSY